MADKDFTADDLTQILCRDYEVDKDRAAADVLALLGKWRGAGFIL